MAEEDGSVVVTTGHTACYPCLRSLAGRGVRTIVAGDDARTPEFVSRFCDERVVTPPHDGDLLAYRDALVGLVARPDVRTLIPTREEDAYLLAKYHDMFDQYVDTVSPSSAVLGRVHDRLRLARAAERAGVPVPETRPMSEVDDWSEPLIVKSRYNLLAGDYLPEFGERRSAQVKAVQHLSPDTPPDLEGLRETYGHEPVVQEFVPTTEEYMVGALYDHGESLATYQHRQLRGNSYLGGGGVYRRSAYVPELASVADRLLEELDWHGLACIEYMRHPETGEFLLTEINPRMWQSLPSTVRAGADFPYYYWLAATGRAAEVDCEYDIGVSSHLLKGELSHLLSVRREQSAYLPRPNFTRRALEIAASCVREPHFDYLRLDDPGPFARTVANYLGRR